MPRKTTIIERFIASSIALTLFFLFTGFKQIEGHEQTKVNVLVIALYGVEIAKVEWQPTIDHLQSSLPQYEFKLIPVPPIELHRIKELVAGQEIDFVITQPAIYVDLELNFGISRILTMVKKEGLSEFGSTLITRSDSGIKTIKDLHGKTICGAAKLGFGGWLVGYKEMLDNGFDPYKDAKEVKFLGDQTKEIQAVLDGVIDVAVIRTGMLEKFSGSNRINLDDFRVLAPKKYPDFPLVVSSELYPEWAFAKTRNSTNELSKAVAIALLSLKKDSPVTQKAGFQEWTLPYDYQPVHKLLKELHVEPYKDYGIITVRGFIAQHMTETVIIFVLATSILLMSLKIYLSNITLSKEISARKQAEAELKKHVKELHKAFDEIKTLRGIIPICSYCKKIRDDKGAWDILEAYICNHSEAQFSHGVCPECYKKQMEDLDKEQKETEQSR
nr:PhnD/SsuA/transferrin family substrate-binding protein [uncultured Desulfobacter sp.]